jgi:hypothetical protein
VEKLVRIEIVPFVVSPDDRASAARAWPQCWGPDPYRIDCRVKDWPKSLVVFIQSNYLCHGREHVEFGDRDHDYEIRVPKETAQMCVADFKFAERRNWVEIASCVA